MDEYSEHRLYIMESLKDIKTGQEDIKKILQDHIKDETEQRVKINMLWSAIVFIIAPIVSFFTAKFVNKL